MKLYVVFRNNLRDNAFAIDVVEISKETQKYYWLQKTTVGFGFYSRIEKDSANIAFSREEAVVKFREKLRAEIDRCKEKLADAENTLIAYEQWEGQHSGSISCG